MHHGSVQQFDIPQRVYARPANMFVAGFMGSPSMNFLDGRLVRDGGVLCVEIPLANGAVAALPLARPPAGAPDDSKVVLGIRPEHLYRYDAELKAKKPALARLTAPVELVEPTGAETVANLRIGDREVVGRFDPDGAPEAGELLDLGIDMTPACLFDPNTQKLIPDAAS
jgi:multiple sugar transport system ATP-binding protein